MTTITELLQETKTLVKRIEKKRAFVKSYAFRLNNIKDPFLKDGGSEALVKAELQAIDDLNNNIIETRKKIAKANADNTITVCGVTKTIEEWLIYRREIAVNQKRFIEDLQKHILGIRNEARQKNVAVATSVSEAGDTDLVINLNEKKLADEIERLEEVLSTLDGQLSLKNATIQI